MSGKVLWTRHIYNLLGERPGDYAPTLASPSANVVYARTEFGVPNGVDTRTGQTLWEHPGLDGCRTDQIVAGPAGVAISQRCPDGKERLALLDPRSGNTLWKNEFSTPQLRLLAVGTNSVALYQGGLVHQVIVLGRDAVAGGAAQPSPAARLHFDGVNVHAERNAAQRQAVADIGRRVGSVFDRLPNL